ncbi:glycosyltransferase family 39 protein [Patescibacteria group bacterium]|nr:glycosyltransferase family 39 protein [Patescibacteria group bacterium]
MNKFLQIISKYKYLIIVLLSFFLIELSWIIISPIHPPYSTPDSQVRFMNIQNYAKGIHTPVIGEPAPLFYFIDGNIDKFVIHTRIYSQFRLLELISVLFSFITLIFTYKIFKLLFNNEEKVSITGTMLTALFPMFTYMGMAIDMDPLVFAMYTAFIYYSLKLLKEKFNFKDFILLTLFLILGLLSKQNMYVNIPVYIGLILYLLYKNNLLKKYLKYLIIATILILVAILGLHSGLNNTVIPRLKQLIPSNNYSILDYYAYFTGGKYFSSHGVVFTSFFATFGYMYQFIHPTALYSALKIFVDIILFGLAITVFNKIKTKTIKNYEIYIIIQVILTFLFIYLLDFGVVSHYGTNFVNGRYFFPVISIITLGSIVGLRTFISKKYYDQLYMFLIICMIFFNLFSLTFLTNFRI